MKKPLFILSLFLVTIGFASCDMEPDTPNQPTSYEIPRLLEDRPEQIINHFAYTVSYNPEWLIPNWVAYCLTKEEQEGDNETKGTFKPDPLVNGYQVMTDDYKGSGYHRGHMAAAADMKWSKQAIRESYYMTNICPQTPSLNNGCWLNLERQVRKWVKEYDSIFIACGPVVRDGHETICDEHPIAVPRAFFKVLLVQTRKHEWRGIGFIMYNEKNIESQPLLSYAMSVDDVERITGIDFFYTLPDSIEEYVEKSFIRHFWFPGQ